MQIQLSREVEVITKNTIVRRTVDKLIPLELCSSEDDNIPLANNPNLEISPPADQIEAEPQLSVRPKRKTAEATRTLFGTLSVRTYYSKPVHFLQAGVWRIFATNIHSECLFFKISLV